MIKTIFAALLLCVLACGSEDDPARENSPAAFVNTVWLLEIKIDENAARGIPAADTDGHIEFSRFIEIGALHYEDLHGYKMEFYRCNPNSLAFGQNESALCIVATDLLLTSACYVEAELDDGNYSTGKGLSPAGGDYSDFSDCTMHEGNMDYTYRVYAR